MTKQPEALRLADILQHQLPIIKYLKKAAAEMRRLHAEVERLRAELARLTTLRPANEWDGETYVLWWRDWDDAGWVIDSVSDSQESGWWTPVFDVSLPNVKETK
jgi:hypothetical protein